MKIEANNINKPSYLSFKLGLNIDGADISIVDDSDNPERGLDIDFEIDKTIDETPNESKITLWNVSNDVYKALVNRTKGATAIELYGAFGHDELSLMFVGTVSQASQEPSKITSTSNQGFLKIDQGVNTAGQNDIPTTITCYDAGLEYDEMLLDKSYKGLVSSEVIIKDCVSRMGLPYGRMDSVIYPDVRDYVARGRCTSILKDITKRIGVKYNITNGIFNLVNPDVETEATGIVLTADNSDRPIFVEIDEETGLERWKIPTGLLPFLQPGTFCLCDFPQLKGTFRIYRVFSKGNNYGTDGITEVYVE